MKFKYPISSEGVQLGITGLVISIFLIPYLFRTATARWVEVRRLRTPSTYKFPTPELAQLDRLLQARFAVPPTNDFGMARIGKRHEIFNAIGAEEQDAIEALRRAQVDVVFYVVGRSYLKKRPIAGTFDASLQGPIYMTQKPPLSVKATPHSKRKKRKYVYNSQPTYQTEKRPINLPDDEQLRASLEGMLLSSSNWDHSATPDGKTYQAAQWQVAAVPVRATDQSCVNCHFRSSGDPNPRLGDPLGIAVYAFRSTTGGPTKTESVSLPVVPTPAP